MESMEENRLNNMEKDTAAMEMRDGEGKLNGMKDTKSSRRLKPLKLRVL